MNIEDIELHCHLWYLDKSKNLLDKLATKFSDRINLSLIKGSKNNDKILKHAESKFKDVRYVTVENYGTDQNGFISSYETNCEDKEWVLYTHDKKDEAWTMDLVNPLVTDEAMELTNDQNLGMITSKKREEKIKSEDNLKKISAMTPPSMKVQIVRSKKTMLWLRELQHILFVSHGMISEKNLDFTFSSGTMFMARSLVINMTHSCIYKDFFELGYRADGEVEHALERFYFYVNKCLNMEHRSI